MKSTFDRMQTNGGFAAFIECTQDGKNEGSMVVFKDPLYRSYRRDDVACFGLVTTANAAVLEAMLDSATHEIEIRGIRVMRGPVNAPRSLFGYGVQVSDHDLPVVAGSASDPPKYKEFFAELDSQGFFDGKDRYFNLLQDFTKTREYIAKFDLDRSFRIENPDFNNMGDLPLQIADMMNRTLVYRPDFLASNITSILAAAEMYKLVTGSERLIGLFYDGDVLAGAVMMQPDWYQVFAGKPVTTIIGDIYMLDKAYQGRRLFMNFSEYSATVLEERGTQYYEHASMWENMDAIKSSVKNGYAKLIKEYWVFEKRV